MPLTVSPLEGGSQRLRFEGRLDAESVARLWPRAEAVVRSAKCMRLAIDASGVTAMDSAGAALLLELQDRVSRRGGDARIEGLSPDKQELLDLYRRTERTRTDLPISRYSGVERVGKAALDLLHAVAARIAFTGEVFAIMGTSGAGKTTILRHLIGLDAPMGGRIWVDGEDLATAAGVDRIRIVRKIGVTFQENALFGSLTLLENVRFPLEEHTELPLRAMNRVARMKLSLVGLGGAEGRLPAEVSGGMKKRAAIARSLAPDPAILFLDEPTTGLDPVTADSIDELIERLSRELKVTCVIVSHSVASVMRVAHRAVVLDPQRRAIVADGNPREIVEKTQDPWVRRFFDPKSAGLVRRES